MVFMALPIVPDKYDKFWNKENDKPFIEVVM